MELSSLKFKKFPIFFQKEFLIFREMEPPKKTGGNFPSSENKKNHSEKISYISGNGTF